jgi:tetratricopeptide (TPR) repeat protein
MVGKGSSFAAGKYWLSQCSKPWLLILDNADDPKMEIANFFPIAGGGHILITSRNPRVKVHATVGDVRFRGLDPEEGIHLLLSSAYDNLKKNDYDKQKVDLARRLGAELGYLALALSQAGTTIRRNIYTLEQYLRVYLGCRNNLLPTTTSVNNLNAVTTWEIPFQTIQQQNSVEYTDAVDLIHIIAFLHFDGIYESLFRPIVALPEDGGGSTVGYPDIINDSSSRSEACEARLRLALEVLTEYSLIDVESEDDSNKRRYSQHPVVHRWAQDRLTPEKYLSSLRCTIKILSRSISPFMETSGQAFRRMLVPHMESCLQKLDRVDPSYPSASGIADSIERFAFVFAECGLWKRAEDLQKRVIKYRTKTLGKKHEITLRSVSNLGQIYWNLFKPDLAIQAQRQIISVKRWIWPSIITFYSPPPWIPDPIGYYSALSDLTMALWLAGMLDLSKRFGTRATQGLLNILGPDDPITLTSMFNLARTLLHLAEWDASHSLLLPVLHKRKLFFGPNHPDTLMARNELGMLYCARKQKLPVAERLVRRVLETRRSILGEEHAYTLWSINDLSKVLCERDKGPEAVRILEPVIAIAIRTLGPNHAGTTMTRGNLARAYVRCQRWSEAEALLVETVGAVSRENRDWVHVVSGYVHVLMQLQRWDDAERNCRDVLDFASSKTKKQKSLTVDGSRVVAVAEQLAQIYHATGRSGEVKALKERFPAMDERVVHTGYRFIPERTKGHPVRIADVEA